MSASAQTGGRREALLSAPVARWLDAGPTEQESVYRLRFSERHIGNPFIRALHGGVVSSLAELAVLLELARLDETAGLELVSVSIDYLRVTKDADLFARVVIVRRARRLAFLDVWCWQDSEAEPIARASCTVRLFTQDG